MTFFENSQGREDQMMEGVPFSYCRIVTFHTVKFLQEVLVVRGILNSDVWEVGLDTGYVMG